MLNSNEGKHKMPVTPFHIIAAAPIANMIPKRFSWSVFTLTNVLIDLDPILSFVITLNPSHGFIHTIFGSTLMAIISATYGRQLCEFLVIQWNNELKGKEIKWLSGDTKISPNSAWIGALVGAWSHLFLDSFMHHDIRPLYPFTDKNILLGQISILNLHIACTASALLGLLFYWIRRRCL